MHVVPGDIALVILGEEEGFVDPADLARLRERMGLNLPLHEQYFSWLGGILRGDLGNSLWTGGPVTSAIATRLPYTLSIIALAVTVTLIAAVPVGVLSAIHQDTWIDYALRSAVITFVSMPHFFLAMLVLLFTVGALGWFPPLEYATLWDAPWIALQQLALPALILGIRFSASSARMMRSTMLEVMREDYVRTARAKGLTERVVLYIHALRNAVLPVVTMIGMEVAMLFSGIVIIETIFHIPGVGLLLLDGIMRKDIPVVQGVVLVIVAFILMVNLLVDLLYAWIDPRIQYQ